MRTRVLLLCSGVTVMTRCGISSWAAGLASEGPSPNTLVYSLGNGEASIVRGVIVEGMKELVEYGVIGLLIGLSFWAVAVAIERWLCYRRIDVHAYPSLDACEIALTKRLVVIGTVAANAPYIGLLGTVLGIMLTFHTMGTSGAMAVTTIMIGLSLALKATAAGLVVAIPCVVMNNMLRRRVSELLAQYKARHGA